MEKLIGILLHAWPPVVYTEDDFPPWLSWTILVALVFFVVGGLIDFFRDRTSKTRTPKTKQRSKRDEEIIGGK
ncbi:MAG TPA: hypothetical protein VFE50_03740 [Cyclobacteriaceae bacterium]|nr:hypothetical protein [Cyclobacteriaceae bacterium]